MKKIVGCSLLVAGCWLLVFDFANALAQPASDLTNSTNAPNGRILHLAEALKIAVDKNLQLQAARKGAGAASWGVKNAYSQFLPSVNLSMNYLRVDANRYSGFESLPEDFRRRLGAYRNTFYPSVNVTQPIFTGGALLANVNVAQAQDLTAQAGLASTEQEVIYDTHKAYFDVLRAQALLNVAKEALQITEEHLNSARKQVEAGLRSKTEILRWEAQKANAESYLAAAENNMALAKPSLNQVLGLEMNADYNVVLVDDLPIEIPATIDERTALALRKNPDMRVAQANVDLAGAQVQAARSTFAPQLGLVYNYSWETNPTIALDGFKTWSLGVSAQFPIFNGFRDYTSVQQAQETRKQTETLQQDFERNLRLRVLQASQALDLAQKSVVLTQKERDFSEENFRVTKHSYEVGLASNLDYLDAQDAMNRARWDYIDARYFSLLAKTALARAMGVLGQ